MRDALWVRREARIGRPIVTLDGSTELLPLTIGTNRECEMPISRREDLIRHDVRMGVAESLRPLAGDQRACATFTIALIVQSCSDTSNALAAPPFPTATKPANTLVAA